jgi:Putative DNA-binding domain
MHSRLALANHIANRDPGSILELMFQQDPVRVRRGFFTEDELWDYKQDIPSPSKGNEGQWAGIAADVLAFHNHKGGVLIFGIRNSDFRFTGATSGIDTKLFNDKIRRYVEDRFLVSFSREAIQFDQRYLGLAVIPPRRSSVVLSAAASPPVNGRTILREGDLCMRIGDETRIRRGMEAFTLTTSSSLTEATLDPHRMKLATPATAKIGDTVWVTWDSKASADRGVRGIYPEPQVGTITNMNRGVVSVYFVYEEDGEYDGPLQENIAIDLETGLDLLYGGVVTSIDLTKPRL